MLIPYPEQKKNIPTARNPILAGKANIPSPFNCEQTCVITTIIQATPFIMVILLIPSPSLLILLLCANGNIHIPIIIHIIVNGIIC